MDDRHFDRRAVTQSRSRELARSLGSQLSRPLPQGWCVLGWTVATFIFVGLTHVLGGVTTGDASDSVNTTWAFSHGAASCGYAPGNQFGLPYTGPLYPLLSSGLAALFRIGDTVPFPTKAQMGPHCSTAVLAMYHWSVRSHALLPTVQLGYVAWFFLLGGVIALLRTSGRGRCGWELMAAAIVAAAPPVYMCLHEYFHPQDLTAMGLVLAGVACVRRGWWTRAGALLGLAFTTQQFALLAIAPLLMITPRQRVSRFAGAALVSVAAVVGPLTALVSTRAISVALVGSGDSSVADTLVGTLHPQARLVLIISRFAPIGLAMVTAWWVSRKIGSAVFEPIPLIALLATSLTYRLIFEVNLWGYYFMAVAVLLIILDAVQGRMRVPLFVWLTLVVIAFYPSTNPPGVFQTAHPLWLPLWLWQLVLVPIGMALAAIPMWSEVQRLTRDGLAAEETLPDPGEQRVTTRAWGRGAQIDTLRRGRS